MAEKSVGWNSTTKEIIFQIVLHILVFLFYTIDRKHPHIEVEQIAFFLQYAIAAFFINYYLLPQYYYKKKTWQFFTLVALTIFAIILTEELVLEQIFYPDNRGQSFSGIFYTLSDVLPITIILTGFKFAWDALGKQREVDNLKSVVKESELQFLKSQINPHFLFNNLNNLYSYALEKSSKTPEIILELSGILRYMLYECKEKYVPLSKEVAQLENFINLSEMQIEERGEVHFTKPEYLADFKIAPLILIVFIENAFKHSTASQSSNISIAVELRLSDQGVLEFICTNSFLQQSNTNSLSQGIGLDNVKKRLELIYPDAHVLSINSDHNNYRVHLTIDLNKTMLS